MITRAWRRGGILSLNIFPMIAGYYTGLEPGHVVSMAPMLWLPEGLAGAGGYREHDILILGDERAENITGFPYGPAHNIIDA